MRRAKRLSLVFFIFGFCSCLLLIGIVRFISKIDWNLFSTTGEVVVFHEKGQCEDCKKISTKYWKIGHLKDKNDLHLECARRIGIVPFQTNNEFDEKISSFVMLGNLKRLEDCYTYKLKSLTHSYPYLVPEAVDLLNEIGVRFQAKLAELGIGPYYMLISSVLRSNEGQNGLGKRNSNATKSISAHLFGTTFDISYKEFLPPHGQAAPEGYCRHDMLRHPLAEVLTEMCAEGRCKVAREVKQACFHVTVSK